MAAVFFNGNARMVMSADAEYDNAPTVYLKKLAIMAHIQPLTGLQPTSVVWEKDPRPMVSDIDNALVLMNLKYSDVLGGSDDKRMTLDPLTGKLQLELTGQRTFRLTMKCEAYNKQAEAYEILERVRTLLNANFELDNIGMCYQNSKLITDLPTSYDNRVVSVAMLELQLGLVSSIIARVPGDVDGQNQYVQTVNTNNVIPGEFTP